MTERRKTVQQVIGRAGEDYTAHWLREQGYTILARNWRCRWGEVDIIARKGGIVAFVEVKTRRPGAMVSPLQAVNRTKQRRIVRTAITWMRVSKSPLQPRLDVAAVTAEQDKGQDLISGFDYYPSAFDASGMF